MDLGFFILEVFLHALCFIFQGLYQLLPFGDVQGFIAFLELLHQQVQLLERLFSFQCFMLFFRLHCNLCFLWSFDDFTERLHRGRDFSDFALSFTNFLFWVFTNFLSWAHNL